MSTNTLAQEYPPKLLMPIGGGYSDIYSGFINAAVSNVNKGDTIKILVLPISLASNPDSITENERAETLKIAERHRSQIDDACLQIAQSELNCTVVIAPILVRSDAEQPDILSYFPSDLTAIFFLDGDQKIAMQVVSDTPVENALNSAYQNGVIIAGTGAGGSLQSATMLAGYFNPDLPPENSLNFGVVDVWNTSDRHGLNFGIQDAILDQHFFQRNRVGRLLNAITLLDVPHIGIGIDAYTGVHVSNGELLKNVFGLYTVAILDAETYHSAKAVQYRGSLHTLSLRNVLVHLLSPGVSAYNITTRQHSLGPPSPILEREFGSLTLPPGAGHLILGGGLGESLDNNILARFANVSGGEKANLLIIAAGYSTDLLAQRTADKYKDAFGIPVQTLVISEDSTQPPDLPEDISGIVIIGGDQSIIQPNLLSPIKQAWLSGTPLLTDAAATAIAGAFYSAHGPTPDDVESAEIATQQSFLVGKTVIVSGLNLLDLTLEPQIIKSNRWGRLFSLAFNHPDLLAFGLTNNTALEITPDGATVLGDNVVFSLDLRTAYLDVGTNLGFVIANGLLDVFSHGDTVQPVVADNNAAPIHVATPVIATPTHTIPAPSPTSTPISSPTPPPPTKTDVPSEEGILPPVETDFPDTTFRPTATPIYIPPPTDPGRTNMMIVFGVLTVIVVIVGVWVNRQRAG